MTSSQSNFSPALQSLGLGNTDSGDLPTRADHTAATTGPSANVSLPLRDEMIKNSELFFSNSEVSSAGLAERVAFLRRKGVNTAEIAEALRRVGLVEEARSVENGAELPSKMPNIPVTSRSAYSGATPVPATDPRYMYSGIKPPEPSGGWGIVSKVGAGLGLVGIGAGLSALLTNFLRDNLLSEAEDDSKSTNLDDVGEFNDIEIKERDDVLTALLQDEKEISPEEGEGESDTKDILDTVLAELKVQGEVVNRTLIRLEKSVDRLTVNNPEKVSLPKSKGTSKKMPWDATEETKMHVDASLDPLLPVFPPQAAVFPPQSPQPTELQIEEIEEPSEPLQEDTNRWEEDLARAMGEMERDRSAESLQQVCRNLSLYINNALSRGPHFFKFRIDSTGMNSFATRVSAYPGARSYLEAAGFGISGAHMQLAPTELSEQPADGAADATELSEKARARLTRALELLAEKLATAVVSDAITTDSAKPIDQSHESHNFPSMVNSFGPPDDIRHNSSESTREEVQIMSSTGGAPQSESFLDVIKLLQSGKKPADVKDIDDSPPDPTLPFSESTSNKPRKPYETKNSNSIDIEHPYAFLQPTRLETISVEKSDDTFDGDSNISDNSNLNCPLLDDMFAQQEPTAHGEVAEVSNEVAQTK
eukprot:118033_1